VALLVVRHARAGKRKNWNGDDRERPLDERGWRQATALAAILSAYPLERLVSSSYARCTQTFEPIAQTVGIELETASALEEGASREETLTLLQQRADAAALSTHGDVLENLFGEAGPKGSTRVVELRDGEPVVLEYLPPPG
jgi:8-oxo-dGTP diphosphatase